MKILMLNPPFLPKYSRFSRSPAVTKSGTIYYPLWHAYATGVLEKAGHDVRLIDAPADGLSRDDCCKIAKEFIPGMTVLFTSTPSILNDVEFAGSLKNLLPDTFIILTGPHVSALPKESLEINKSIDAVARREYDMTLVELAGKLEKNESIKNVEGITFRNGSEIKSNPDREPIKGLDSIPFVSEVYKKHLKLENYFYAHCRFPVISIFTSRGCFGQCNYCVYPEQMFGRKQRQRSPENIVAEFEYIEKKLPQVKEVLIDDDTFSFDQSHTIKFCDLMIEKGIKLPWTVECRATLTFETMIKMKKAGCRLIVVGFESADKNILKNIKKGVTLERAEQFVKDAKKAGIMIHSCFMVGNEGETKETMEKSLKFAKKINADTCQFFPLMVYPGTEAYDWAKSNNYIRANCFRDWLTEDGMHNCVISTPELTSAELVNFCDYARRKYYLSTKYLFYKITHLVTNPSEIVKTVKAAKTFFRYLFLKQSKKNI
jgi:anaerobic magnesium-protoporphyrin IX monomethyl ester cyclase